MAYDDNRHQSSPAPGEDAAPASGEQPTARARPRKVGYKSPPEDHQWKPGKPSPNPKGRPRRRSIHETIHTFLNEPAGVSGELSDLNRFEILLRVLFKKVSEGNLEAIRVFKQWGSEAESGVVKELLMKVGALTNGFGEHADDAAILSRVDDIIETYGEAFDEAAREWPKMYQERVVNSLDNPYNDPFEYTPKCSSNVTDRLNNAMKRAQEEQERINNELEQARQAQDKEKLKNKAKEPVDITLLIRAYKPQLDKMRKNSPARYNEMKKAWNEILSDEELDKEKSGKQKKDAPSRARRR